MAVAVDLSIIIVNYNTYNLVLQCIDSVIKYTKGLNFEIIVVDNNSPNREITQLNNVFPNVNLILNNNNSGFGTANNIGSKAAKGEFLLLLNSDTIVFNNSIYELYKFIKNNKKVGACGGNLCDVNLEPAASFTRFMPSLISDLDGLFVNFISKIMYGKDVSYCYSEFPIEINGNISGADLMLSKKIFEELNGFDESFFMYYEETDLLYRLRESNFKTYIVPQSKIIHLEGASESIKEIKLDWTYESKEKYFLKNKSSFELLLSDFIFKLTVFQRLFMFMILRNKDKYNYWLGFYKWLKKKD